MTGRRLATGRRQHDKTARPIRGLPGSRPQIASFEDRPLGLGELTEFSVGGPTFNPRTESHLRRMLPGPAGAVRPVRGTV